MRYTFVAPVLAIVLAFSFTSRAQAQDQRPSLQKQSTKQKQSTTTSQPSAPQTEAEPTDDNQEDVETLKVSTNLVTVPVIANDREGTYVPDLKKEEFTIFEDGVKQDVSFFATVDEPFQVVLLLDTSASTQFQIRQIVRAAINFTEQLQPTDRLKVISFDDEVRDLCDFTSDRAVQQRAIKMIKAGQGTRLYDAMRLALDTLRPIKGRRAIVLFTDGVDWHSLEATYEENRRAVEEAGIIVYPIRYDTREATERIARGEETGGGSNGSGGILGGVIRRHPGGTTAPTFPGSEPSTLPGRGPGGPLGMPSPPIIGGGGGRDSRTDPRNTRDRLPPDASDPNGGYPESRVPEDSISAMLDRAYKLADEYLNELAQKSGGKVVRADNLTVLPDAFAEIAAELHTQYSLGYYPTNTARDDKYRKILVKTTRKNVALRAKPGYRTMSNERPARRRRQTSD